ncbi:MULTISPECIES: hypothetical protein [unclassified Dysgonomonas]|uniref:hypothetical protein n=1 Tax=unclassified Dysgonomonas TaxID=2630389 RepID=UPI0024754672|nr:MULTISPECIES: hypothetical protein [unclassified Dysgonomonas]
MVVAGWCFYTLSEHEVESGYVVDKEHLPESTEMVYDTTFNLDTPQTTPECFVIWVADRNGVEEIYVSEDEFNEIKEGQKWQRNSL